MLHHRVAWAVLLLASGALAAPAGATEVDADASASAPHAAALSVVFAVPAQDGTPDPTLQDKIIELFGLAADHSTVHMSMYQLSHGAVVDAILAAAQRDVRFHIILDRQENLTADKRGPNPAVAKLVAGLPADAVTFCTRGDGSCIGAHIDHNKIYMFSALSDGSTNVVVQSSANLTTEHLHNNMVIDRNDKALYDDYVAYWGDLQKQKENLDYYQTANGDHTTAYHYPRAAGDTILTILGKVKCTPASTIRITMAFWDDGRMTIADELARLRAQGCTVRVNMRTAGESSSAHVIQRLRDGKVDVGLYPATHGTNIHSKYLLIDSDYETAGAGVKHRALVWTGSHNYTGGALRKNDETLLRVDDAQVFAAFVANWTAIRAQIDAAK